MTRKIWTQEETVLMRDNTLSVDDLCQLMPYRSRLSIYKKRQEINRKKGATKKRLAGKKWTNDEDQIVISNAHKTCAELKKMLPNRTIYAINIRRAKLTTRTARIKSTTKMIEWLIDNNALISKRGLKWAHEQFCKEFDVTCTYHSFKHRRERIVRKVMKNEIEQELAIAKKKLPDPVAQCRKALLEKKFTPIECANKWGEIVANAALKSLRPQADILRDIETSAQRRFIIENKDMPDDRIAFFLTTTTRQVAAFRKSQNL